MDNYGNGEPKAAQEPMYTRPGSSRAISTGLNPPPAPRQPTQIEALTRDFTQAANRLNLFNANLEQKLEMFSPSHRLGEPGNKATADPPPPDGTLAALHYQSNRLRTEVERYGALTERLAEII